MVEIILRIIPILISIASLVYTIYLNYKTRKVREQVESVQLDVLKASELYVHVKDAKKIYEDAMADLSVVCANENSEKKDVQEKFLRAYNRYIDFFNEVNEFCIMVNIGAIKAKDYIKNTISVNISKYAKIQYETFSVLQGIAEEYNFEKLDKPDYRAFEDYDKFLIFYNGGENSAFWTNIKINRRQAGFE